MQNKYSVIVFDLGNVLLPFDYNIMLNKLEKIEKDLGKNFLTYYMENYDIHRKFERGDLPEEDFIKKMLSGLNNKISKETFCEYYSKVFAVNEEVASLLPKLKMDYMLVLLSNTNSIHELYWKNYGFIKYFDKLVLSYKVRALKPEEKIYKAVESITKRSSDEHIFIDDIEEYAEGAKKAGWDAIHFTGYENLLEELRERKIF